MSVHQSVGLSVCLCTSLLSLTAPLSGFTPSCSDTLPTSYSLARKAVHLHLQRAASRDQGPVGMTGAGEALSVWEEGGRCKWGRTHILQLHRHTGSMLLCSEHRPALLLVSFPCCARERCARVQSPSGKPPGKALPRGDRESVPSC